MYFNDFLSYVCVVLKFGVPYYCGDYYVLVNNYITTYLDSKEDPFDLLYIALTLLTFMEESYR